MPPPAVFAVAPIADLKLRCPMLYGRAFGSPFPLYHSLPRHGCVARLLHRKALAGDPRTVRPDSFGTTAIAG